MVTYITAQYRHVVVCSGLYPVRSQSLHGGYSSGCIESAMQPSSTEKSSRTTLHYVIQNDSTRDLVLLLIALTLQIQSGKCCALGGFLIELWSIACSKLLCTTTMHWYHNSIRNPPSAQHFPL